MPDVIIIGGGIFGLSVGWSLRQSGADVLILDPNPGDGASGGLVGALTPHAPTRWRPMMAFQFDALIGLPDRIAQIEAETGHQTGYARAGRLTPLGSARERDRAEADVIAAKETWRGAGAMDILDAPDQIADWIDPEVARFGIVRDTVSARVDPRAYVAALVAGLAPVLRSERARRLGVGGRVELEGGVVQADHIVVAAGWQTWPLVDFAMPGITGQPVKGQAALLAADTMAGTPPVIYRDGLYIVPHEGNRVAVGSTSEKRYEDAKTTDAQLEVVIEKARGTCPALRDAPVQERWAGLRPKPPGREPVVGPVPGHDGLWIASGGYKISFGIAHAVGDALAAMIAGKPADLPLPETFLPQAAVAD